MDWCADYTMRLVGVPRLRQLRVKPGGCVVPSVIKPCVRECVLPWRDSTSDKDLYGVGWHRANWEDRHRYLNFWRYTDPWNSSVFELSGKTGTIYPSGGYTVDLAASRLESRRILDNIKYLNWQDEYTRVTFAEFTLYNINNNMFSQVAMVTEHLPYGLFVTISHVDSVRIWQKFNVWIVIYLIFVLILLIRILYKINRNGFMKFIKTFLSAYELFVIGLAILCLFMYVIHLKQSSYYAHEFMKQGKDQFFHFNTIMDYFLYTKICCVLLFCLVVFRLFVSWNFGRTYYTYYFTFTLSLAWIFNITACICLSIFVVWRLFGYLLNVFVFSNYRITLVQYKSSKFLKHDSTPMRTSLIICIVFLLSLWFKVVCFILFCYYYKVAKNYNMHPLHNFNFLNLISQEVKDRLKKKNKELSNVTVV